jgi:amino acid adenylation domain-containing protein
VLHGDELERQISFWRNKLVDAPEALDVPSDHPRPAQQTGEGDTVWLSIPTDKTEALRELGLREGATLNMVALTAWALLLQRITGQNDLVIGMPVRGRALPELEKVMGFFVNTLPLRLRMDSDASFLENLRTVRGEVVDAFGHQDAPFEHLVRVLNIPRDESRFPIYQAFFSHQDARGRTTTWGNLEHENVPVFQPSAAQDLALWFLEGPRGAVGGLNYNTDILSAETAERLKVRFLALVDEIIADPAAATRRLCRITDGERAELARWNDTASPAPAQRNLAAYLGEAFAKYGSRIAVCAGDESLTYDELAAEAEKVRGAIATHGKGVGDVIGLYVDRSPRMLAALVGVLRSGATYLPLDPMFPNDRLRFMLDDSKTELIVADSDVGGLAQGRIVVRVDQPLAHLEVAPPTLADPEQAAYLIYTSGSTGRPKGVRVPHRAVTNFLASMSRTPGLDQNDRLLAVTTLSFDISVLEMFLPLSVGAQIIVASKSDVYDGHRLSELIKEKRVTCMQATPATWRLLLEARWRGSASLRALCGGEALPPDLAEELMGRVGELWNMYGPTETTVWSSCARIVPGLGGVTIGRPIANTEIWVLDDALEPVPIGCTGEIYIGGEGVTLGYHERPDLTLERFIPDTLSKRAGGKLYRTGDLGRYRNDGQLVHLGRSDFQVKVRGYRIELGEIEEALSKVDDVSQAVVVASPGPGGENQLVAYWVSRSGADRSNADMREALVGALPDYMVPSVFMRLAEIPTTPNNKVDRRALPNPGGQSKRKANGDYTAPRTDAENMVAEVWGGLLNVEGIQIDDNFLDLGGHSLLVMRAVARLEQRTGKVVSPRAFIYQTLEQVAREYAPELAATAPAAPHLLDPPPKTPRAAQLVRRLFSAFSRRQG